MQDERFDQENKLFSIPSTFGKHKALMLARIFHSITVIGLALAGVASGSGAIYMAGVVVCALLLLYEHSLVKPGDLSKLDAAFFTMNGVISIVFFGFVLAERLV